MNLSNLFNKIIFEKIVSEKDADIKKILKIRNEEKVRNSMINDEIIITEDHVSWLLGHLKINKKIFYKIKFLNELIGLITLDTNEKKIFHGHFIFLKKLKKVLERL